MKVPGYLTVYERGHLLHGGIVRRCLALTLKEGDPMFVAVAPQRVVAHPPIQV